MQSSQSFPSSLPASTYCTADFASFVSAADVLAPVTEAIAMPANVQTLLATNFKKNIALLGAAWMLLLIPEPWPFALGW